MPERLYRKAEARELLRVSRASLDRLTLRSDLEIVRLDEHSVRIAEPAMATLLAAGTVRRGAWTLIWR